MKSQATIALVGNPNVGKTTLFNALTGQNHVTGNYPGVTVERKVGAISLNGSKALAIDLPGTYSLAARSPDEMIVVDVLLGLVPGERPIDIVVAVVDATNLERNLYLVTQLQELDKPVVIALNMVDLAEKRGIHIDAEKLGRQVGVPVVPVCAHKRIGVNKLIEALHQVAMNRPVCTAKGPQFPEAFQAAIDTLQREINQEGGRLGRQVPRVEAFRAFVDEGGYAEQRLLHKLDGAFMGKIARHRQKLGLEGSLAAVEVRSRYSWIREAVAGAVKKPDSTVVTTSDKLDDILTHKVFGTLLFLVLMALVFQAIYNWSAPFMDVIDAVCSRLGGWVGNLVPPGALQSLIVDGVIAGVGSVIIFIPQILILTFFIALLEDCGYMARAAFLMDKVLSKCALSGQSFIPLMSSFACAVPGVMATRTITNQRDRFATILVAPLMSCSARLPVYMLMIAAFIPNVPLLGGVLGLQGVTLFAMYGVGIVVAIPVAWLLKRTVLKGEAQPFLLELPSYKWPQLRTVVWKVKGQATEFLKRAGTIIFAVTVVVWALAYFPHSKAISAKYAAQRGQVLASLPEGPKRAVTLAAVNAEESGTHLRNSIFGHMGRAVEPIVSPLGWDWRIGMASLASFPAREIVVATLGTVFNIGADTDESSEGLQTALRDATRPDGSKLFTIPVAISIMIFYALCCQCAATLAIIKRETRSWRWPAITFGYMTVIAYAASFAVYHLTNWLGWG